MNIMQLIAFLIYGLYYSVLIIYIYISFFKTSCIFSGNKVVVVVKRHIVIDFLTCLYPSLIFHC